MLRLYPPPRRLRIVALACSALAIAGLGSCSVPSTRDHAARVALVGEIGSNAQRSLPEPAPWLPLRGRTDFEPSDLTPRQRLWYERLRAAIGASRPKMVDRAEGDDVYDFGRWLFQYNSALLVGLRTTGDLRFLDEIDVVGETLRKRLSDGWCGGVARRVHVNAAYGTVREPDGYRNFRLRAESGRDYCRDTGDLNEALTHGHLAMVMYAYHANRDLPSPGGVDYEERADFWLDYLRNDFEAKWRERSGTPWPAMDFIDLKFCHTYVQMMLYYHFVGQRLMDDGSGEAEPYLREVMRLTDGMFDLPYVPGRYAGGFIDVDTPEGPAVVYSFGAPGDEEVRPVHLEACPITYARYMATSVLALRMEAVARWDDAITARMATGLAHFVVETEDVQEEPEPFAAGVSGSQRVAGLPPTTYGGRFTVDDFILTPFAAFTAWDDSDQLERAILDAYESAESDVDAPRHVYVPAGMLFAETVGAWTE